MEELIYSMNVAADVKNDNAGSEDDAENETVAAVAEDDNVESEGEIKHSDAASVAEDDENEEMDEAAAEERVLRNELITSAYNIANVLAGATELNGDVMDWAIKESLALTRKLCDLQDMEGLPE